MDYQIAPSLLSANFAQLERDIRMIEQAGAHMLHIDVMDGHFVPNITIGLPVLEAIKRVTTLPCDVHLMIAQPEKFIDAFCAAGADILTIHAEATPHVHRALQAIRAHGVKAGLALNPHTPLSVLEEVLEAVDLILIMSVNPGFGGQAFIPRTLDKLRRLRQMLEQHGRTERVRVEVDGGIKYDNIDIVAAAGAQVLVSGSGIFKTKDPPATIAAMAAKLQKITAPETAA